MYLKFISIESKIGKVGFVEKVIFFQNNYFLWVKQFFLKIFDFFIILLVGKRNVLVKLHIFLHFKVIFGRFIF